MKSKIFLVKIKRIFLKELKISVNLNNKIYDYKKWDSMGNFNILLRCEKYFNIKFTSTEFTKINSVKEILFSITKKIKK